MISYIHLIVALFSLGAAACSSPQTTKEPASPQAVRAVEVRIGPLEEGHSYLAEVVAERAIKVIAQVPGTVTLLPVEEGEHAAYGSPLVRVSAPDVAARVARVRSERKRAERERDFACTTLHSDRALAASGDLSAFQLERSERACASAELVVEGARAGEKEASVAKSRGVERAPFDGEVLMHLVDEGQTVMPGSPLMQFASRERLLRLRVPKSDLQGVEVGGSVSTEVGMGSITKIGAQALGPGRVIEVLVKMDSTHSLRVGTTLSARLVTSRTDKASAVPDGAVAGLAGAHYIMVVEGEGLGRVEVTLGVRQDGWVAVEPSLVEGTQVAVGAVASVDPSAPVMVVTP